MIVEKNHNCFGYLDIIKVFGQNFSMIFFPKYGKKGHGTHDSMLHLSEI